MGDNLAMSCYGDVLALLGLADKLESWSFASAMEYVAIRRLSGILATDGQNIAGVETEQGASSRYECGRSSGARRLKVKL